MSVSVDRFVKYPSWGPGTLVSNSEQFFIVVRHDKGSIWHAFGSKEGRTLISDKDTEIRTENVQCGNPKRKGKVS